MNQTKLEAEIFELKRDLAMVASILSETLSQLHGIKADNPVRENLLEVIRKNGK